MEINSITPIYERQTKIALHGPGPSDVPHSVLAALRSPTIGHLDPAFQTIMDETKAMLRETFQTRNAMTFPISGTGSAGMQTLCNLFKAGETVLVAENGVFGRRVSDCLQRQKVIAKPIRLGWGEPLTPDRLEDALKTTPYTKGVFVVHGETSAGLLQPDLPQLAEIAHRYDALFMLDAVASLAGSPLKIDEWNIDACYSGTQKCLSVPPGLSPVTLNDKTMRRARSSKTAWYFDLGDIETYWREGKRAYHHTAPVNMVYALHEGLRRVLDEGLENRIEKHQTQSRRLTKGLEAMGFRYHIKNQAHRMPMLHLVYLPEHHEDIDEADLRKELRERYHTEIAGGLGDLAGKAWRIGIMGESCTEEKTDRLLHAIGKTLHDRGIIDYEGIGLYAAKALAP